MAQPRMFTLASTFAKIDSGLRPKNLAGYLCSLESEATSAKGVFEAMCQDHEISDFLVPTVRYTVRLTCDSLRQIKAEYPQRANAERNILLARALMSVSRLWNAIEGQNVANIAMYSLLVQHQLCDFTAHQE